jgi:enterochelin esterase-like enzyme
MGGLIALYTAARLPHIFAKVFSQSGAFSMGDHPTVIFDLLRNAPRLPLKLWLDVGKYDFNGLITANEQMFALLREKSYPFETRVYPAGPTPPGVMTCGAGWNICLLSRLSLRPQHLH